MSVRKRAELDAIFGSEVVLVAIRSVGPRNAEAFLYNERLNPETM